ncbi:hypothetical protein EGW08_000346 [Elysia chlorotica]|uniref:Orc1-like AAA ATPase domain-containing protein n=1 Tax=Elysia chlorotica TaxID=188477 RepID=A0A3S1CGF8_ELYCH|nr:hypothetical protein EGW08_000346 [Elysia chlorotica]
MAALANIRHVERERLRGLLLPGHLVQVSGPPMVGKLTVVNQVLRDMGSASRLQDSLSRTPHAGPFIQHRFSCQSAAGGLSVLANMAAKLERPLHGWEDLNSATAAVLGDLRAAVLLADQGRGAPCHHIFVFEKCEALVTRDADFWFLGFLSALMRALASHLVTVVFTSYKRFQWSGGDGGGFPGNRDRLVTGPVQDGDGHVCWTLEIGQLMDIDILSLLQHFAPAVNPSPYLYIFQRFLGFPEAVRKVAQTFLLGTTVGAALSSASLETVVKTDYAFLHSVFSSRLGEVMDWVGWENLLLLRHFGNSLDSSATMGTV